MERSFLLAALLTAGALIPADALHARSPQGQPAAAAAGDLAFEVASVKPNNRNEVMVNVNIAPGGRFVATNIPVRELVRLAYQLQDFQITGGPAWAAADRFDIDAKATRDLPPMGPFGPVGPGHMMLRALLAERFKLVVHTETREMPVYALVKSRADGRLGAGLRATSPECSAAGRATAPPPPPGPPRPGDGPGCRTLFGIGTLMARNMSMTQFAQTLGVAVGRPVTDATELSGSFDADLKWTPDLLPQAPADRQPPPGAPPVPPARPDGPSIFA